MRLLGAASRSELLKEEGNGRELVLVTLAMPGLQPEGGDVLISELLSNAAACDPERTPAAAIFALVELRPERADAVLQRLVACPCGDADYALLSAAAALRSLELPVRDATAAKRLLECRVSLRGRQRTIEEVLGSVPLAGKDLDAVRAWAESEGWIGCSVRSPEAYSAAK